MILLSSTLVDRYHLNGKQAQKKGLAAKWTNAQRERWIAKRTPWNDSH